MGQEYPQSRPSDTIWYTANPPPLKYKHINIVQTFLFLKDNPCLSFAPNDFIDSLIKRQQSQKGSCIYCDEGMSQ